MCDVCLFPSRLLDWDCECCAHTFSCQVWRKSLRSLSGRRSKKLADPASFEPYEGANLNVKCPACDTKEDLMVVYARCEWIMCIHCLKTFTDILSIHPELDSDEQSSSEKALTTDKGDHE